MNKKVPESWEKGRIFFSNQALQTPNGPFKFENFPLLIQLITILNKQRPGLLGSKAGVSN